MEKSGAPVFASKVLFAASGFVFYALRCHHLIVGWRRFCLLFRIAVCWCRERGDISWVDCWALFSLSWKELKLLIIFMCNIFFSEFYYTFFFFFCVAFPHNAPVRSLSTATKLLLTSISDQSCLRRITREGKTSHQLCTLNPNVNKGGNGIDRIILGQRVQIPRGRRRGSSLATRTKQTPQNPIFASPPPSPGAAIPCRPSTAKESTTVRCLVVGATKTTKAKNKSREFY